MSSKQLIRLAIVLFAALLLWGAVALGSRRSDTSISGTALPKVDTSGVDTITMRGPHDTTTLIKVGGGKWQASGHPAEPQAVASLLRALADTATATELVAKNPASHARLNVSEDSGRRVRVAAHGRTLLDLITGKSTTEGGGVYFRHAQQSEVYVLRGELASVLGRSAEEWRNHTVASVFPDSVVSIDVQRGNRSYTVRKKGKGWVLSSGSQADSAAVAGLLAAYHSLKVSGFGTKAQQDSLRLAKPRRTARLSTASGGTLLNVAFDSAASGFWIRVSGRSAGEGTDTEAYRLDTWLADQLTPAETSLRKK